MLDINAHFETKFPFLTEEDKALLLLNSKIVQHDAGDILVRAGEKSWSFFLVLAGLLRNYHVNDAGEERTVLFTTEGASIGAYATFYMNVPAIETIAAVEPSIVIQNDFRKFRELADCNQRIAQCYMIGLEEMLVKAIKRIDEFALLNHEQRYRNFVNENPGLVKRIPQKYLASYLGMTTISLSRIKSRIKK